MKPIPSANNYPPVKRCIFSFLSAWTAVASFAVAAGEVPVMEAPGSPPNAAAELLVQEDGLAFTIRYDGQETLAARLSGKATVTSRVTGSGAAGQNAITQTLDFLSENPVTVKAVIRAGSEAIAAETRGSAQEKFPLVRTSHGLSQNLRNNAIYDRNGDWMIEFPHGSRITAQQETDGTTRFDVTCEGGNPEILFRPRYYQKHKNIEQFEPWTYPVWKGPVTGWCSWWAYHTQFRQEHNEALLKVWTEKRFADYGYRFIQIDDVFQGAKDDARRHSPLRNGYTGGQPDTWLDWRPDRFPGGLAGYVNSVQRAGFKPGVWIGSYFSTIEPTEQHPDWFVQDKDGKPADVEWASYVVDATNPEAADALIRPTFRGLAHAGMEYVKIDQLRHMLYDNLHNHIEWCRKRGIRPGDVMRRYLRIAREELGRDTFILSCWGVLPESVGLADGCRIGGDGYGPVTMQQYNSWNGIVWRNDPDHCDVLPRFKAAEEGNVKKTEEVSAIEKDTIIRPALASIAGCMLMLSDRPEVYEDERNLTGLRKSAPVLFSVPGQLYDFDPAKTDRLASMRRTEITSGTKPSPIDGDQHGEVCPWWLNEIDIGFDHWSVLHHLNWSDAEQPARQIAMADLGFDPAKPYLVYEFWTDKMLGVVKGELPAPGLEAKGLHSYAIREMADHPQLISTNRHLSQGAVDLESLGWEGDALIGRSRVIAGDPYMLVVHVPEGYTLDGASFDGLAAEVKCDGATARISFVPQGTQSIPWTVNFSNSGKR